MASGPITSWQIDGETMETVRDFIFLGSKITADGDCSHEIKRRLLLGRKAMSSLDSRLKSRDNTLPTKVHLVKAMAFSVATKGCKSCLRIGCPAIENIGGTIRINKELCVACGVCKQLCHFAKKGVYSQSYGLSSSHVWM